MRDRLNRRERILMAIVQGLYQTAWSVSRERLAAKRVDATLVQIPAFTAQVQLRAAQIQAAAGGK